MGSLCFKIGSVEGECRRWYEKGNGENAPCFQIVTGLNGSSDAPVSCRDLTNGCVCEQR